MKKSLITTAGVAAFAVAAVPMAAFAVGNNGTITDTISTTVAETCSFVRQDTKHGTGTWTPGSAEAGSTDVMTAATIQIGSEQVLGTSNFNVVCNDHDGYQVTMSTPNLTLPSEQTQNHVWAYVGTAPAKVTASYWRVDTTGDNAVLAPTTGNPVVVSQKASSEDSKDFTITYNAYAVATQDAGTYSADVVYTFAQK